MKVKVEVPQEQDNGFVFTLDAGLGVVAAIIAARFQHRMQRVLRCDRLKSFESVQATSQEL